MSAYHLAPDLIPHYIDALDHYHIKYIFGYTSSLYALAHESLRLGHRAKMKVVVTNGEALRDYQRGVIGEAFGCEVRETYGMGEMVAAASECGEATLHQWPEVGMVELLDANHAAASEAAAIESAAGVTAVGESIGEFICTGLLNEDMPLIRYRVGDCGSLGDEASACPCGRSLPTIAGLEGRKDDLLITRDGRRLFFLNPVFYQVPVLEAQIVQESLEKVRVRYVPAQDFTAVSSRIITERLQARMGRIEVVLEEVEKVPRSSNSKFRAVICNIPATELPCAPDEKPVLL
jgi:phenylacetate-CoA ligase